MRPGLRYKIAWAVYGTLCLGAGAASLHHPQHQALMIAGLALGWAAMCYVTLRQAPAKP